MEKDIIILQEMYKTLSMGAESIHDVIDKIDNKTIKKEMKDTQKKYLKYKSEVEEILDEYGEEVKEVNPLIKVYNDIYSEIKLMNAPDNKIVEMMMKGTNKAIIKLQEIKNNESIEDKRIIKILNELLELFEYQVDAWKKYL